MSDVQLHVEQIKPRAECPTCHRPMIRCEQALTSFPHHHIEGTRQEYCGVCGPIPVITMQTKGPFKLVPNKP